MIAQMETRGIKVFLEPVEKDNLLKILKLTIEAIADVAKEHFSEGGVTFTVFEYDKFSRVHLFLIVNKEPIEINDKKTLNSVCRLINSRKMN